MKENQIKYAELILKDCLKIQAGQPLLITAPIEAYEFIEIIVEEACKLGVEDIAFNVLEEDEEFVNKVIAEYNRKRNL